MQKLGLNLTVVLSDSISEGSSGCGDNKGTSKHMHKVDVIVVDFARISLHAVSENVSICSQDPSKT